MTYASQWHRFAAWCEERGVVDPLDAGAAQVAAYLAERAETRKLSTVQASAAAIAAAARSAGRAERVCPTKTPLVADTLRGIARQHAAAPEAAPRQATALDDSRAKYQALRSRGHGHARSLRSVADRLLNVACAMLRDGACFDPHRVGIPAT